MVRTFNNKLVTYSNRVLTTSGVISFLVNGSNFASFGVSFSSSSSIFIDFSDGTGFHQYEGNASNSFRVGFQLSATPGAYVYNYTDGKPSSYTRNIKVIIPEKDKVTSINVNDFARAGLIASVLNQTLKIRFNELQNLNTINISQTYLLDFDDSFLNNNSIKSLIFNTNSFYKTSKYSGIIPITVLTKKQYNSLTYSTSLGGIDFSISNLDKIINLKDTLTTLSLAACNLSDTNGNNGPLPDNFSQLKIASLYLIRNNYTKPPSILNSIPTIQNFFGGGVSITDWGDLSGLVNLVNFTMDECRNAPAYCPAYVTNWPKLRILRFVSFSKGGSGGDNTSNPARLDALISSIYNIWDKNAPKTGSNNIQYRGVQLFFAAGEALTQSDAPGGTYQQPNDYVAGSSNGTPVSAREMLWVLANQYSCTVIYNNL
ncbi:hypothetical protein [Mucilaginibacter sp. KACC 22063]|uniref:hypothetical protein n=1 Tax=Mucilaginibacter sp. KACC 22063 TaxID=3025666 RepID=UPI002365BFFE|nr:hypothetical protein [Mucilaginibacter sp. KACC 22063]WDF54667.1 hypothetical protein PQ461_17175 [Mucilaginibacter sp. KACC 22063]